MAGMNNREKPTYLEHFVRPKNVPFYGPKQKENGKFIGSGLDARKFYEDLVSEGEAENKKDELTLEKLNQADVKLHSGFSKGKSRFAATHTDTRRSEDDKKSGLENGEIHRLRMRRENERHFQTKNSLFQAITVGNIEKVKEIISSRSSLLNIEDEYGWSPLMSAVAAGNLKIVKYFVENGVDIYEKKDLAGYNAWDLAIRFNHQEIIDFFADRRVKRECKYYENKEDCANGQGNNINEDNAFCNICNIRVISSQLKKHESSLSHLFNLYKEEKTPTSYQIGSSNIGYKMLKEAGWSEDKGLGPEGRGQQYPIATILKNDRSGFGLRDKKRKRVTHFKANDAKSVKGSQQSTYRNGKNLFKKEKQKFQKKSKQWERNLRAYMNRD
ncbi:G patch domain and ankyrin repeat-containing protein 1-like [Rhopilema esculentum]|uniref:G patch domain and ankyrin repeat-containing protein 1-like n=1 Tax=Rhopilema esculentum TaxID=499914 RepID=UPI0031CF7F61|eukprot:gene9414-17128_t